MIISHVRNLTNILGLGLLALSIITHEYMVSSDEIRHELYEKPKN
jgi:hypothetical protein